MTLFENIRNRIRQKLSAKQRRKLVAYSQRAGVVAAALAVIVGGALFIYKRASADVTYNYGGIVYGKEAEHLLATVGGTTVKVSDENVPFWGNAVIQNGVTTANYAFPKDMTISQSIKITYDSDVYGYKPAADSVQTGSESVHYSLVTGGNTSETVYILDDKQGYLSPEITPSLIISSGARNDVSASDAFFLENYFTDQNNGYDKTSNDGWVALNGEPGNKYSNSNMPVGLIAGTYTYYVPYYTDDVIPTKSLGDRFWEYYKDDFRNSLTSYYKWKYADNCIAIDYNLSNDGSELVTGVIGKFLENNTELVAYSNESDIPLYIHDEVSNVDRKLVAVQYITINRAYFSNTVDKVTNNVTTTKNNKFFMLLFDSYTMNVSYVERVDVPTIDAIGINDENQFGKGSAVKISASDTLLLTINNSECSAQYLLSNTKYDDPTKEITSGWKDAVKYDDTNNIYSVDLSENADNPYKYIYVRSYYNTANNDYANSTSHESSEVVRQELDYYKVSTQTVVSSKVSEDVLNAGDHISLTASGGKALYYFITNTAIDMKSGSEFVGYEKVDISNYESLGLTDADNLGEVSGVIDSVIDNEYYVKLNGIWYRLYSNNKDASSKYALVASGSSVEIPSSILNFNNPICYVYAFGIMNGEEPAVSATQFVYCLDIKAPLVTSWGGEKAVAGTTDMEISIPFDDYFVLVNSSYNGSSYVATSIPFGATAEYYLSSTKISSTNTITNWTTYTTPIDNDNNDYICTRYSYSVDLDNDGNTEKIYTTPEWTQINYYEDAPMSRRVQVKADGAVLLNGSLISVNDKLELVPSKSGSYMVYVADYTCTIDNVTLTKLDVNSEKTLIDTLEASASGKDNAVVDSGDISYIRINGLWYASSSKLRVYNSSGTGIVVDSDILSNRQLNLFTLEVSDGENPQTTFAKNSFPVEYYEPNLYYMNVDEAEAMTDVEKHWTKVDHPVAGGEKEVLLSTDSKLMLKNEANSFNGNAQGVIQYYFTQNKVSDVSSINNWKKLDDEAKWLTLPDSGLPTYLYVRTYYGDGQKPAIDYIGEYRYEIYKINGVQTDRDLSVKYSPEAGSVMSSNKVTVSSMAGNTLYYAVLTDLNDKPTLSVVQSFPNDLGAGNGQTKYILVNGVLYESSVPLNKKLLTEGDVSVDVTLDGSNSYKVCAVAVCEGYEPEGGYKFYEAGYLSGELGGKVTVDFESDICSSSTTAWKQVATDGSAYELDNMKKSQDDEVIFSISNVADTTGMVVQYYFSATKVTNTDSISNWSNYNVNASAKEGIPVAKNTYLYTRIYIENTGYSSVVERKIDYFDKASLVTQFKVYNTDGEEVSNAKTIDVNDKLIVTAPGAAVLLYSDDQDRIPTFTKMSYQNRCSIDPDNMVGRTISNVTYITVNDSETGDFVCYYIKHNGLWYVTSDNVSIIERDSVESIVDDQIRTNNSYSFYALALKEETDGNGIEAGTFAGEKYIYAMSKQAPDPVATPSSTDDDGSTHRVKSGDSIILDYPFGTYLQGMKIFYTTNGSVPSIEIGPDGPVAGTNTVEYSKPIEIPKNIGSVGENIRINAQIVYFIEQDGIWYRAYRDSNVITFVYVLGELTPVEDVTSIPNTSAEQIAQVIPGNRIQLATGTQDAKIFYTIDGSEPTYEKIINDDDSVEYNPTGVTYEYKNGVIMPQHDGISTYFTITTIAVREDMQPSNIVRLVFAYPSVVSAPYASPGEGSLNENTEVVLNTATTGAIIYYEIAYGDDEPANPTTSSNVFSADSSIPFKITKKTTIKAFALKDGMSSAISKFTFTVSDKLTVPSPSIANGSVVSSGTMLTLNAASGATVYYTTDGSDPKTKDNAKLMVGTSIVLNAEAGKTITIRTYATKNGYSDSDAGVYNYTISAYEGGVYADKETGSVLQSGAVIHLSTDVSGGKIYYTTDGSVPTINSNNGTSVTISGNPGDKITVIAFALVSGTTTSNGRGTFTYTIMDQLAAPSFSVPDGAIFTEEATLTITSEKGRIYYTTDGSIPTTGSNLYRNGIRISGPVTIRAIAVADDMQSSEIATYRYGFANQVATPTCSEESGEIEVGTEISFETITEGAEIYYRTDGKTPDPNDSLTTTRYSGPIVIEKATNFKVIAVMEHMQDSSILSVGFTVKEIEVVEEVVEEITVDNSNNGRLQSRRDYLSTEEGTSYTDVVMKNAVYGVVVSSDEGVVESDVVLTVEKVRTTETNEKQVKNALGNTYNVVDVYEIKLYKDGVEIQPEGTIEIGIPIPDDNQNSIVELVHLLDNGTVAVCETRRSGGIAYAKVQSLSSFAVAAPSALESNKFNFPWKPVLYAFGVVLLAAGGLLIYKFSKSRREGLENE